jgi:Na+-driven multidrug efflux pump
LVSSRQGVVSILAIILNHTLYSYGGEHSIIVYGIISKTLIFALPFLDNTTFIPIAGYNYGAENYERERKVPIKYAALLATFVLSL